MTSYPNGPAKNVECSMHGCNYSIRMGFPNNQCYFIIVRNNTNDEVLNQSPRVNQLWHSLTCEWSDSKLPALYSTTVVDSGLYSAHLQEMAFLSTFYWIFVAGYCIVIANGKFVQSYWYYHWGMRRGIPSKKCIFVLKKLNKFSAA